MNDDLKQIFWIVVVSAIAILLLIGCDNKEKQNDFEPAGVFESSVVPITPEIVVIPEENERKTPTLKEEYR